MSAFPVHHAETDAEIARVFSVMRELRPHIKSESEFVARVRGQESESYRLIYVEADGKPVACAGYRIMNLLYAGKSLYVDDLVCLEPFRGKGYAQALMRWMEAHARDEGCDMFHLDSGTQRIPAHRFYYRLGLAVTSFHFAKPLVRRRPRITKL